MRLDGWSGRICFFESLLCPRIFADLLCINGADKPLASKSAFFVSDAFSRVFHNILPAFTGSAQFIWSFALSSLMLGKRFRQSVVRNVFQNYGDY